MAYPMNAERSRRGVQCVVNTCRGRDTYLFFRGRDYGRTPMNLCTECIHDIVEQFVKVAGAEEAYALLADVVDKIVPTETPAAEAVEETAEETVEETEREAPKKKGRKAE